MRIYIEEEAFLYPRVEKLLTSYPNAEKIICHHYGEIFNLKNQNFRIQKEQKPALIIAVKKGKKVLPTPENFGIGEKNNNFYFSHMQNCLYDCRYCFLQGMYASANYLWFVNYEDFFLEIEEKIKFLVKEKIYFFSGYDCDSLAMENITNFASEFLPFFQNQSQNAILEFRTKSINIKEFLHREVIKNVLIAFSFTPEEISKKVEHKTATIRARIETMCKLSKLGWQVGIRLDPIIYHKNYQEQYQKLLVDLFKELDGNNLHSISIGALRFPKKMYEKISKLYKEEPLLSYKLEKRENMVSYSKEIEDETQDYITDLLKKYVDNKIIFSCS